MSIFVQHIKKQISSSCKSASILKSCFGLLHNRQVILTTYFYPLLIEGQISIKHTDLDDPLGRSNNDTILFLSRTNINQDDGDDENDENDESSRDELDKSANIKIKHSKREAVYRDFQKETKVRVHSRFEF